MSVEEPGAAAFHREPTRRRGRRIGRRLLALGLLAAFGVPFWIALSAQRAERLRREQVEDTARLLLVQRIAADAERSLQDWRRAAALLASDPRIRAPFVAPSEAGRQSGSERLAEAADILGVKSIRAQDVSGRVFAGFGDGGGLDDPDSVEEASIALRAAVTDGGVTRGQLVVFVPVSVVFGEIATSDLGSFSVNRLDGRAVLDAEGQRRGVVLDAALAPAASLREAGISPSAPGGRNVVFALVPSLPLLVSITGQAPQAETAPGTLLLLGGALLAFGALGAFAWGMRVAEKAAASREERPG